MRALTHAKEGRIDPELGEVADAIDDLVPRVGDLIRSIERPEAPAVGVWSAVETAVHLTHTAELDLGAAAGSLSAERRSVLEGTDLRGLDERTQRMVREDLDRDLDRVAKRFEEAALAVAEELSRATHDRSVTWLGGSVLPLSALGAHVVEESLVHGRDIARSQGRRWPIEFEHAAMAVGRFVFAVMEAMDTQAVVDAEKTAGFSACYEFRVRGAGRIYFVFDDGAFRVERAWTGPIDVHVSADPATFLLVTLNRAGKLRPALTGRMRVWGRRPWLMGRLSQLVQSP